MKIYDMRLAVQGGALAFSLAFAPVVVSAAPKTFQELIGLLIDLANLTIPILMGIAVLLYFWNVSRSLFSVGEANEREKMKDTILWGLGILFVMVSVWGILNMLKQTFFEGGL